MEPANPRDRITTHAPSRTQDDSPAKRTTARRSCENVRARGNIERSRACTARRVCKQHMGETRKEKRRKAPDRCLGHSHGGITPSSGFAGGTIAQTCVVTEIPPPRRVQKSPRQSPRMGLSPHALASATRTGASRHAQALPTGRSHKRGRLPRSHPRAACKRPPGNTQEWSSAPRIGMPELVKRSPSLRPKPCKQSKRRQKKFRRRTTACGGGAGGHHRRATPCPCFPSHGLRVRAYDEGGLRRTHSTVPAGVTGTSPLKRLKCKNQSDRRRHWNV